MAKLSRSRFLGTVKAIAPQNRGGAIAYFQQEMLASEAQRLSSGYEMLFAARFTNIGHFCFQQFFINTFFKVCTPGLWIIL